MTDEPETLHDLLDRIDEITDGDDHYHHAIAEDLDPYHDLLEEHDLPVAMAAFKNAGIGIPLLHQHLDMLLLAAADDHQATEEFLETTRWYE